MSERTPDGTLVLEHNPPPGGGIPAVHDAALAKKIESFMRARVGRVWSVNHEFESRFVHIDIHLVPPSRKSDLWVLFTTGMSALPMTIPPDSCPHCLADRAELVLGLPSDWFDDADVACGGRTPVQKAWPIRLLRTLARLPHENRTWLDVGHTVPNGDPPERWTPECRFDGAVLLPPIGILEQPWFVPATAKRGRVQFMSPIVLHPEEMDFKLEHGLDALTDRFDAAGVTAVLDPHRPSVVPRPARK